MQSHKVSIITPLYNSESFIAETIQSVIAQTYNNWEMLIVDDCSTDNSKSIIEDFSKHDDRIKYFKTNSPSGSPTIPRNIGIEMASGRFIAFLDSDDLWNSDKLQLQIPLFNDEKVGIVFSDYEKINEEGQSDKRFIIAPNEVSYKDLLKGNVIACLTVIFDSEKLSKLYFTKQGHEDYVFWLSILKKGYIAKNVGHVLAKYRVRKSSVSSNKFKVIKWYYEIYRKNEKLSIPQTLYYLMIALSKSFFKYVK
ncbi:glycosyltransferase family 2 protein [Flavobacterium branchiarum]|uniref:Glycosyltransferase family 2 protein n=1 Tax=Flavobacterium branchiarum TaxID=1114870 RepID=A0ABV5FNT4_9FLAO|nr:glycosyltransferase family 2 protein [Flavobacterium branchiarum]MDN3671922.1 glycosyltransferase family 2 protein [Flavobacterium branchiarum]